MSQRDSVASMNSVRKEQEQLLVSPQNIFREITLNLPYWDGFVDAVKLHAAGVIWIEGWARNPECVVSLPTLKVDEKQIDATDVFRVNRPDVSSVTGSEAIHGVVWEFNLRETFSRDVPAYPVSLEVAIGSQIVVTGLIHLRPVDYDVILGTDQVLHRDDIYTSASTPPTMVSEDVIAIAKTLPDPILDFGCGLGGLVAALRRLGKDVVGIDLDLPSVVSNVVLEARDHVTFYDGTLPLPFVDGAFNSVICSECLEHIPDFQAAIRELSRLARQRVLVTVPNIDAIPLLAPHYCIPWHLLEEDHRNFFTIKTLKREFTTYFPNITSLRLHPKQINGTRYFANLGLIGSR